MLVTRLFVTIQESVFDTQFAFHRANLIGQGAKSLSNVCERKEKPTARAVQGEMRSFATIHLSTLNCSRPSEISLSQWRTTLILLDALAGAEWEYSDEGKVVDVQPQCNTSILDGFAYATFKHSQALAAGDVWRMKVE